MLRVPPPIKRTITILRKNQNLTPAELAALAGVSVPLLYKLESGKPVSREYALKVCEALGENIEDVEELNIKE